MTEDVGFAWQGLEVEREKTFSKHKIVLSGFSLGVRRELFYAFTSFGQAKAERHWTGRPVSDGPMERTITPMCFR